MACFMQGLACVSLNVTADRLFGVIMLGLSLKWHVLCRV